MRIYDDEVVWVASLLQRSLQSRCARIIRYLVVVLHLSTFDCFPMLHSVMLIYLYQLALSLCLRGG